MKRLTVHWQDGTHEVCVLEYKDGATSVVRCTEKVEPDIDRWIRRGFAEYIGEPGNRRPQMTKPDDPCFIDRIAERLRGYNFKVGLEELDE